MKVLNIIFSALVGLVLLALFVAIFVKREYGVEREIVIQKPKSEVFDYIKYLKNQDNYSVWAMKDPAMKKTYAGTDATVGFVSAWDSEQKEVGKGEQEIKNIINGKKIEYELRFIKPFEANDYAFLTTSGINESQTKVVWGFKGKFKYPMNLMNLFLDMEGMLGKDLQYGLNNLKQILEKK